MCMHSCVCMHSCACKYSCTVCEMKTFGFYVCSRKKMVSFYGRVCVCVCV